jgi:hypothetical protein
VRRSVDGYTSAGKYLGPRTFGHTGFTGVHFYFHLIDCIIKWVILDADTALGVWLMALTCIGNRHVACCTGWATVRLMDEMDHGQVGADNLKLRSGFWCLDVCRDISVDRS